MRDGGSDRIPTAPADGCDGDVKQRRFLLVASVADLEGVIGMALA